MTETATIAESNDAHLDREQRLKRLDRLADWLDSKFTIPGTKFSFGFDSIIGLVPGIGDTATLFVSAYIIYEAHKLGASGPMKLRMIWNVLLDWLVGIVPVLGDIFDAAFKANKKNVDLIRHEHGRV